MGVVANVDAVVVFVVAVVVFSLMLLLFSLMLLLLLLPMLMLLFIYKEWKSIFNEPQTQSYRAKRSNCKFGTIHPRGLKR